MMNLVPVYKYVKSNPLIKLNVNDRVYVVNGFTFLSNQYGVTRLILKTLLRLAYLRRQLLISIFLIILKVI